MTERHPYIGELTVENVDRFLARMARERLRHVILEYQLSTIPGQPADPAIKNGLSFDTAILRAGDCGTDKRAVLQAMIDDSTVENLRASRDAEGNITRPAGLYLNPDASDAG